MEEQQRIAVQPEVSHSWQPGQLRRLRLTLLILGVICAGVLVPVYLHKWKAERKADGVVNLLQPLIAADLRFKRVRAWRTADHVVVGGIVASEEDKRQLRILVDVANPPQEVSYILQIEPELK